MLETLIAIILTLASAEIPLEAVPKSAEYQKGVAELAAIIIDVSKDGALVSPEVDAALLSSVAWFESRYRPDSPDGDCRELGLGGEYVRTCNAVGPMQLSKGAGQYLAQEDPSLKGTRAEALRDPRTSVRGGYAALRLWKRLCGKTPAHWLTAYVWGKCPRTPDWEGLRRCALATAILDKLDKKPEGFTCGHEGRTVEGHTKFLVRKLKKAVWTSPSPSSRSTDSPTTAAAP